MLSFFGIATKPYIGNLYDLPATNNDAIFGKQPALPPTSVVTQFFWANYGVGTTNPNIAVNISIPAKGPRVLLDKILSVRIDNLGNPVPVYVYFPDTNYTVACPPDTVVWEPVKTNQFTAFIIAEGFTDNQIGNSAVYFCNFSTVPFQNNSFPQFTPLWKASATITRGNTIYNQNFGVPALGDQTAQYPVAGTNPPVLATNLWGTPYPSGFLYLTHIDVKVLEAVGTAVGDLGVTWVLESTGISGTLYTFSFATVALAANDLRTTPISILNFSAMNIKLDATQIWRLRVTAATNIQGISYQHVFNFTINPT